MLTKYKCALRRDTIKTIMKIPTEDPSPDKEGLSQESKDLIDSEIAKYGLSADVGNSILSLMPLSGVKLEDIACLQTYEEYLRGMGADFHDYVISKSNPTLVEEWDSKIRAFNDDLERIRREKDEQKMKAFYDEMMAFLRQREFSFIQFPAFLPLFSYSRLPRSGLCPTTGANKKV